MGYRKRFWPSFWIKPVLAAALVALADGLFLNRRIGSTLGAFAGALIVATIIAQPASRKDPRARWALLAAAALALGLADRPTFLGWLLFYTALCVSVLSPRVAAKEDGWRWSQRLFLQAILGLGGPILDIFRMKRWWRGSATAMRGYLAVLALPLIGGSVFLTLFALANPIIAKGLASLQLPALDLWRLIFWGLSLVLAWTFLRPRYPRAFWPSPNGAGEARFGGASITSVGLSLVVFNALFAVENGLDIAFLWSGAPLPHGVTLAGYAHRGAYPLIATALLAGVFVLAVLRPGSKSARQPWLRRLVLLWVAQNLLLVASSALRTLDYIEVYSLTRLRIAALIWMGLVAVGLVLICWRMWHGKSASWLINANLRAAGLVLVVCSVVDLGAIAADWNVGHAREVGGRGAALDLCYLNELGDSAVVPLSRLQTVRLSPSFRDRVAWVRSQSLADLTRRQAGWPAWAWRGQRRLDQASAILPAGARLAAALPGGRECDGAIDPPAGPTPVPTAPVAPVPARLTPAPSH